MSKLTRKPNPIHLLVQGSHVKVASGDVKVVAEINASQYQWWTVRFEDSPEWHIYNRLGVNRDTPELNLKEIVSTQGEKGVSNGGLNEQ